MQQYQQELKQERRQLQRARAHGALVRPPRDERELILEERANEAEIDMLAARRSKLFSILGGSIGTLFETERGRYAYDLESASRSLDLAYAAKRRLQVARDLFRRGVFA